jgi:hypothetical protein
MVYCMMHDANMLIKFNKIFFNFFNSCKIQQVQLWWINSYSHNTNKSQFMTTSMIGLVVVLDIIWLYDCIAYDKKV